MLSSYIAHIQCSSALHTPLVTGPVHSFTISTPFLDYTALAAISAIGTIVAIKLKMINQDRMIFGDFSVNFEPFSLKFGKGYFLLKS